MQQCHWRIALSNPYKLSSTYGIPSSRDIIPNNNVFAVSHVPVTFAHCGYLILKEMVDTNRALVDIASALKQLYDKQYGENWHCIVSTMVTFGYMGRVEIIKIRYRNVLVDLWRLEYWKSLHDVMDRAKQSDKIEDKRYTGS